MILERPAQRGAGLIGVGDPGQSVSGEDLGEGLAGTVGGGSIALPDDTDRIWTVYGVSLDGPRLVENRKIGADATVGFELWLPAGEAFVATAKPADLQDDLMATIELEDREVIVGNPVEATLTVRNIGAEPIRGRLVPVGQPSEWKVEALGGDAFRDLAPGETFTTRARIHPTTATELTGSAVYAFVAYRKPRMRTIRAGSIPQRLRALAPLEFDVLPLQTYAAPGHDYVLEVSARNTFSRDIAGSLHVDAPSGWRIDAPVDYKLAMGESERYAIGFSPAAGAEPGAERIRIAFEYADTRFREDAMVVVRDFVYRDSVPVDLAPYRDSDLFTELDAPDDVANFGGPFSYPARFYPSDETVSYLGVDFTFPDTATGVVNGVHADGDRVTVEPGAYDELAILSSATNGDKTVTFTFVYGDGSTDEVEIGITDWCVDAKYGELEIARAPYRHNPTGILRDAEPRIMFRTLRVDASKELEAIVLPTQSDYWLIAVSLIREE